MCFWRKQRATPRIWDDRTNIFRKRCSYWRPRIAINAALKQLYPDTYSNKTINDFSIHVANAELAAFTPILDSAGTVLDYQVRRLSAQATLHEWQGAPHQALGA
jgi:hypothetical protein